MSVDGRVQETSTKPAPDVVRCLSSDAWGGCAVVLATPPGREAEAAQETWQTHGHVFTMEDGRPLDPASSLAVPADPQGRHAAAQS